MEELSTIIVVVLLILALFLSFSIGANDETSAPLAAAGTVKFKIILILGGIGLIIGILFLSQEVASTVGKTFIGPDVKYTIYMLSSVLISAIIWLIIGSFAGIPLSSTHSLFGAIIGVIIVYITFQGINISGAFNWAKMVSVIFGWILSPIIGFLLTYFLYKITAKFFLNKFKGLNAIESSEKFFAWCLLITVFGVEIYTGANSAEALGILYALYDSSYLNTLSYWFWKVILGIFAFLGIFIAGRYVIKNLASQTTDARPSEGFILQLSTFIVLFVVTPLGLPISHSHVIVFCIIGLNIAKKQEVDYKGIGKMAIYWLLTLPIAAIIGGLIYFGFYMNGFI